MVCCERDPEPPARAAGLNLVGWEKGYATSTSCVIIVTQILCAIEAGDPKAAAELLPWSTTAEGDRSHGDRLGRRTAHQGSFAPFGN